MKKKLSLVLATKSVRKWKLVFLIHQSMAFNDEDEAHHHTLDVHDVQFPESLHFLL